MDSFQETNWEDGQLGLNTKMNDLFFLHARKGHFRSWTYSAKYSGSSYQHGQTPL